MATFISPRSDDVSHWLQSPKRQELRASTGELFVDTATSNRAGPSRTSPTWRPSRSLLQSEAGAAAMKFDGVHPETIMIFEKASDHV